ncbi:hypothetical protein A1704_12390 [Chryseobacterium cucumeris]|uniref:hypothetical protein n=1 Tax=Chryseobacterium TaxID=59732 RepID=UPI000788762D|nr:MULTISPECIES: hypothetical protein [Chryseobacterium]KYH05885.1 hypothetical protein A1704_12390 [Chryseobacterium cucumeris]RKE82467.1 hypothetical protein DEU39_2025 [Chryseobacterium sp. AG363]
MNAIIKKLSILSVLISLMSFCSFLLAQVYPIGQMFLTTYGQSFTMYNTGVIVQDGNPGNAGQAVYDQTGINYLRLPSAVPYQKAFFLDFNKNIIELDYRYGYRVVGYSNIPVPPPPVMYLPKPTYDNQIGIETAEGLRPLPTQIIDEQKPYGDVMMTSEQNAVDCYKNSLNFDGSLNQMKFGDCMVTNMAGQKELEIYKCAKNSATMEEQSLCMLSILGGSKEKQITQDMLKCYKEYGGNYEMYPLCFADKVNDPELKQLVSCFKDQANSGEISFMGTAVCYGASKLNLNTEAQIAVECAVSTGGQPYAFAGCAGGQLTYRELNKCLTNGVGGDNGCFGKNNTIVKGLNQIGDALKGQFGPNNDIVKTWNTTVHDLQYGPGKNHEAVKVVRNISNELGKAGTNVAKEIKKVVPKIKIKW